MTDTYPLRAVPGYYGRKPGIQIGSYVASNATDDDLKLLQQLDVEWAMLVVKEPSHHSAEYYQAFAKRLADYGLKIYRVANHSVHNVDQITLNLPGRDEKIEEFCDFLRNLAAAGIRYNTYAHMGNGIWSTGATSGRGGVHARQLDITQAIGHWDGREYKGNLTHGRTYTDEELWENYAYFLGKVRRVADALGGIPRCIFGNFEGYQRALDIADSPNFGVCLCVGCWLEGGKVGMGCDVIQAIEHFGKQGKLFKIHFRNVSNPMPAPWQETFIDDGYQDMHRVMQALRAVDYDGCIIPDHIPQMVGGPGAGLAFSIAYMRALVQAVNNEAADLKTNPSPG